MKNTKTVAKSASQEALDFLNNSFPVDDSRAQRMTLPRLGMLSKDLTEETKDPKTKKKTINVIQSAGTFFLERQSEEEEEVERDGKKVKVKPWNKDFFEGQDTIDVVIVYQRKQLRFFEEGTGWISSPIYDTPDQVVPLFQGGKEIHRGTPKELQALYPKVTKKGKASTSLNEEKILYTLYEGELFQTNLTQSSKWAFSDYAKEHAVASVVTRIGSTAEENGSNKYNVMTFEEVRPINAEEAELAVEKVKEIQASIEQAKAFYASSDAADKDQKELAGASSEAGTAKKGKDF